jgi:hypothetical protein
MKMYTVTFSVSSVPPVSKYTRTERIDRPATVTTATRVLAQFTWVGEGIPFGLYREAKTC